jgi:hypothetical protein
MRRACCIVVVSLAATCLPTFAAAEAARKQIAVGSRGLVVSGNADATAAGKVD